MLLRCFRKFIPPFSCSNREINFPVFAEVGKRCKSCKLYIRYALGVSPALHVFTLSLFHIHVLSSDAFYNADSSRALLSLGSVCGKLFLFRLRKSSLFNFHKAAAELERKAFLIKKFSFAVLGVR